MGKKRQQKASIADVCRAVCFDVRSASAIELSEHLQEVRETIEKWIAKINAGSGAIRKLQAEYEAKLDRWREAKAKWWKKHGVETSLPEELATCTSGTRGLELADYISWAVKDLSAIAKVLSQIASDLPKSRNNHEAMRTHASSLRELVILCADIEQNWDRIRDDYSGEPFWTTDLNIIQKQLVEAGGICPLLTKVADRLDVLHESLPDSKETSKGKRKPGPGRDPTYSPAEIKRVEEAIKETGGSVKTAAARLDMPLREVKLMHDAARQRRNRTS